jgi:hypothetical protein
MPLDDIERQTIVDFVRHFPPAPHSAMDCSHFVCCAIKTVRPDLPYMTTETMAQKMERVDSPRPGDIIYFPNPGHVAVLVLADGIWFVGSQTSTGVCPVREENYYWMEHACMFLQLE